MIYFSILGLNDYSSDIRDPFNTCGATLSIFMDLKDQIDSVYLFQSKTGDEKDLIIEKSSDTHQKIMKMENKELSFRTINLDFLNDPTDYSIIFPEMKAKITKVMVENDILEKEKVINISSGTPTMTTCWVFLQQSGAIPNARLIQGRPKEYARRFGKSHEEVKFETKWFPTIEPGQSELNQLESSSKKVEKLKAQVSNQELHDQFQSS